MYGAIRLDGDWPGFRNSCRSVCDNFLTLAVASLLSDMKSELFFQNLYRVAENWRRYLVSSATHFKKRTSLLYNTPLYAAIIANDSDLLSEVANVLPTGWSKSEEYEDQFHASMLHTCLSLNGCRLSDQAKLLLQALVNCETDSLRSDLFKSLLGVDDLKETDFWESFENALYTHEEYVNGRVASIATNIRQFVPHRYIWFEGIVWLRFAISKGFVLPSKMIAFCPDEALQKYPRAYFNDWKLVPLPNEGI